VFDPERDEDHGVRPYYLRLLAVLVISAAGCLALLPSVTAFWTGVNQEKGCLAIVDGWHGDRGGLSAEEKAAETGFVGLQPSERQLALLRRAETYLDWRNGPGACVPESRHRLILSGLGLGGLAAVVGGATIVRRTRTSLRRAPAVAAGT
jgi:hypothetical protein